MEGQIIDSIEKMKAEISDKVRELVLTLTGNIFNQNPNIQVIRWTQYTPYFMDGDPCVFRVGDVEYSTNDSDDEDFNEPGMVFGDKALYDAMERIEDDLKAAFGDHVRVTIRRSAPTDVIVEAYDHD